MKILQIINSLNTGGAEKLLLETIPLYNKKGINVDLLLLNGAESPFLIELKKQQCCNVYSLGIGSVYNPFLIFKIIPYLKKYDVVHVHLFPALYWVALAKLFLCSSVQLVFTEHNTTNKRRSMVLLKFIDKLIYKKYDILVGISTKVIKNLKIHLRGGEKEFRLIQNGVNLNKITDALPNLKKDFCSENSKLIIQVSSFTKQKDQDTLIRATSKLSFKSELLLVGEGPLLQEAKALAERLGLNQRVHFLGQRMDVPELLKTADIVVLSSRYEGLSLSSVEGLASGKPFIASNVPGLREVVKGAGVLFEQGNYKELAERITHLMEDKLYYNEVSKRCVERSKKYDINKMVDKHIKLYEEI
jgi:glycosyltransferase involved in cell wall biosynthesis